MFRPRTSPRRAAKLTLAAGLLAAALPASASAGSAGVGSVGMPVWEGQTQERRDALTFSGAGGGSINDTNQVTVNDSINANTWVTQDVVTPMTGPAPGTGGPCQLTTPNAVFCSGAQVGDIRFYRADLFGGNDRFSMQSSYLNGGGAAFGGDGDDLMVGYNLTMPGISPSVPRDYLDGGPGSDLVFGGRGEDRLIGGEGDDSVIGREASNLTPVRDVAICGPGNDIALLDLRDARSVDCERVERAAVDEGGILSIRSTSLRRGSSRVPVKLHCPRDSKTPCNGTLSIRKGKRTLGSARYRIAKGARATVRVPVRGQATGDVLVRSVEQDSQGRDKTSEAELRLR